MLTRAACSWASFSSMRLRARSRTSATSLDALQDQHAAWEQARKRLTASKCMLSNKAELQLDWMHIGRKCLCTTASQGHERACAGGVPQLECMPSRCSTVVQAGLQGRPAAVLSSTSQVAKVL